MSRWAAAKQVIDLDWRDEWREICAGTMGEGHPPLVFDLVELLDQAYLKNDRSGFLALKTQLVNQPSWRASSPISKPSPAVVPVKSTAPSIPPASPTLWDAIGDATSP